jgi:aminoglycoside phosphotransferase (APT) family kinase protein
MSDTPTPDGSVEPHAPKTTVDRSSYAPGLTRWFEQRDDGRRDIEVSGVDIPMATGFSNETAFFELDWSDADGTHHQRYVARIEPGSGPLFPPQTSETTVSVGLQYRIMATVREHGIPVPPTVDYEPGSSVLGHPFFVMEFVDGVIPSDTPRYSQAGFVVDEATPDERQRMVRSGLEAMAAIHAIDWRAAGLDWLDSSVDGNPTQADQLRLYREWVDHHLAGRPHPVLDRALDWLSANDPQDERIGLIWGDSRLGNIIWKDYSPAAVVDWEACALSPGEADLGWWLMFDRMSFDDLGAPRPEGFPTREEMIDMYAEASGREVRHPEYWEVFGAMRFCAIMIPLGDRMVAAGLMPEEASMAIENDVTAAVVRLLDQFASL